jgi:sugar phosphate isomerase/epimerase
MKLTNTFFLSLLCLVALSACNSGADTSSSDADSSQTISADSGSVDGFTLGVQMWTFRMFSFTDALNKVDSAGIKSIEAFFGQPLGGDMKGNFGPEMDAGTRSKLKALLQSKGISIVAMGVISPANKSEWVKAFELAKEFGLSYITAEPKKDQWDVADSLSGAYGIKIAIHDHPRPSAYWSPDSVLAAMQGHSNIGACADIGHWARNGLDPVDCLKKLDGHVFGAHLKDIVKFDDTKAADTVVGKGVIDFPAVFAELKRQNFRGMFSIEHESNWYHNLPDVIAIKEYFNTEVAKLK